MNNDETMTITMKRALIYTILVFVVSEISAQDIAGYWEGKIAISKKDSLTLGVQAEYRSDTLYVEMDSPDQYFTGQPVSHVQWKDSVLSFRVPKLGFEFSGRLSADGNVMRCTCIQYKQTFPGTLSRGATRKVFRRPQTPAPPYPYRTEEVNFHDRDGKRPLIFGTLTLPNSTPKGLVVFISGSGWQDRDETIYAHKPFAVLADTLTRAGFATYRYDDFPTAIFRKSTTYDFADAVSMILDSLCKRDELKNLNIALLGHSEGSLVAFMVAAKDPRVDFTVHLGGVAQPFEEILLYQSEAIFRASGELTDKEIENTVAISKKIYEVVKKSKNKEQCMEKIGKLWDELSAQLSEEEKQKYNMTPESKLTMIQTFGSPWYYTLFHINPISYLKKVKTPVLAISGEKDLQVDAVAAQNNMRKYLKKNPLSEYYIQPDCNHLLQPCTTGSLDEYGQIEITIEPAVMTTIVSWLDKMYLFTNYSQNP